MLRRILSVQVVMVFILGLGLSLAHEKQEAADQSAHSRQAQSGAKTGASSGAGKANKTKSRPIKSMTVTTSSAKAKDLYQRAVQDYELLYLERSLIGFRAAAKEDPQFAAAFAMVAFNTRDPEETRTAREQARTLAAKASPGEKLMIQWFDNIEEGKYLEGIVAMNDLIAMFPRDKHIYYFAANWLIGVNGLEQAHTFLHKALEVDTDYPPALNDLAYLHARNRQFEEAFQDMERYAALLPKEPNPQDSYGEVLRMAGRYEASLDHYRAALAIDPNFNTSQLGLGDTYALMGDQEKARQEYDKAIEKEPNPANRFDYRMQKAITWVREKNYVEADRELWRISVEAHAQSYEFQEAQALLRMAHYAADDQLALERLASAEDALTHKHNLLPSDRDEALAQILRVRASRWSHASKPDEAQKALTQLAALAATNHSRTIQACWHGAAGASLAAQGNLKEAIPELEEDQDNPETLAVLIKAYKDAAAAGKSQEAEARLRSTNMPSLEKILASDLLEVKPAQTQDPVAAK